MSSNSKGSEPIKFTLYTAGLHGKVINETDKEREKEKEKEKERDREREKEKDRGISPPKISARSKNSNVPITSNPPNKPKPKRPSSANPRLRSANQHREPGKPQKNHPILSNPGANGGGGGPTQPPQKRVEHEYEGRNFAVMNK
jgi:hypothetical protein